VSQEDRNLLLDFLRNPGQREFNAVLRPLPYPEPDRLLRLERTVTTDERGPRVVGFDPKIVELARESRSFEALASYARRGVPFHQAHRIVGRLVRERLRKFE